MIGAVRVSRNTFAGQNILADIKIRFLLAALAQLDAAASEARA
jgi:hypothetical protein